MENYIKVFNKLLSRHEFQYTGLQMAEWSGLSNSQISRFINNKTDIPTSKFFQLIKSMPEQFQYCFWVELLKLNEERNWRSLVTTASFEDIEEIIQAITDRYRKIEQGSKSLAA